MSVHNAPGCGRARTSVIEINTNTVAPIIKDDRQLSTRTLESFLNIEDVTEPNTDTKTQNPR